MSLHCMRVAARTADPHLQRIRHAVVGVLVSKGAMLALPVQQAQVAALGPRPLWSVHAGR